MKGFVDEQLRALIRLPVAASSNDSRTEIMVWVDTAFNGGLVVPQKQIAALGLTQPTTIEAVLADGKTVELEMFACFLDWFGKTYQTEVVANDGQYPLLGTMLLNGRRLTIDYQARTVEIV